MKKQGTIVRWDAEHQAGHIRSPQTPAQVYFHERDYEGPRPVREGTVVEFDEIHVGGKGPRALSVRLAPPPPLREAEPLKEAPREPLLEPVGISKAQRWREAQAQKRLTYIVLGLLGSWLLLWLVGIGFGRFPWVVLAGVVLVNIAALFLYWRDQDVRENGGTAWPAEYLHLAAVLGGWPTAWLAQHSLKHLLDDKPFQRLFVTTAGLNFLLLLGWVVWPLFATP